MAQRRTASGSAQGGGSSGEGDRGYRLVERWRLLWVVDEKVRDLFRLGLAG